MRGVGEGIEMIKRQFVKFFKELLKKMKIEKLRNGKFK